MSAVGNVVSGISHEKCLVCLDGHSAWWWRPVPKGVVHVVIFRLVSFTPPMLNSTFNTLTTLLSASCPANSVCVDLFKHHQCLCNVGFVGPQCNPIQPSDECSNGTHDCHFFADCIDLGNEMLQLLKARSSSVISIPKNKTNPTATRANVKKTIMTLI